MKITFFLYIIFLNKVVFVVTRSKNLKFITSKFIPSRSQEVFLAVMKWIKYIYSHRGFIITYYNYYNDFDTLQDVLNSLKIKINTIGKDKHILEIYKCIRTIKERTRATWKIIPFNNIPTRVIIEVVIAISMWIKMFPITDGISTKHFPSTLVTGIQVNCKNIATSSLYLTPKHMNIMITEYDPRKLEPSPYMKH